jgi:hypothetical protein
LASSDWSISVKRKLTNGRVFALKGYTVKIDRGKFFVSPTGLNRWAGPYKSLQHATTAIARKLSREFTQRNKRLQQHQADPTVWMRERRP